MNEVSAQPAAAAVPPAPKKKSGALKWILGCGCGCLLLVGIAIVAAILFPAILYKAGMRHKYVETRQLVTSTGDTVTFTNSPIGLDGVLADNYVDFTVKYPRAWKVDPTAGRKGSKNFFEVARKDGEYTRESFTVGYISGNFSEENFKDTAVVSRVVNNFAATVSKQFPNYQKLGEGYLTFGKYQAYEISLAFSNTTAEKGLVHLWMRGMAVKNPNASNGVFVLLMGGSVHPDIKSVDDVGARGELPAIVDSFEFTKNE